MRPFQLICKKGFTIVELLVVISIIALLVSVLLPSLSTAREASRRVVCRSNMKQLYTAAAVYATDYKDHLPYYTGYWSMGYFGYIYAEAANAPVKFYLRDYANCNVDMGANNSGLSTSYKNIGYCPSAKLYMTPGDDCWDHRYSYALRGFGFYMCDQGGSNGCPSLNNASAPADSPKNFIQDLVYTPNAPAPLASNNHFYTGGNVLASDGSGVWVDYQKWAPEVITGAMIPRGYYTQTIADNVPSDVSTGSYGMLYVTYPDGTTHGAGYDYTYWVANRRLFGY